MRSFWSLTCLLGIGVVFGLKVLLFPPVAGAQSCEQITCNKDTQDENTYLGCIKDKQVCWEGKISEAQSAKITLTNTISILNGKINVQELQIEQTLAEISKLDREIGDLTERIGGLNISLDKLSAIFVKRITEQYKRSYVNPLFLLFSERSLPKAIHEYKYIKAARKQTTEAMERAENQRQLFDEQKSLKESKQAEVESKRLQLERQQGELTKQRSEQQYLLSETKQSEVRYQEELAKTLQELEAIQSIIAGLGNETQVGAVKQGDTIASIIVGASACSTGTHLHFEVAKDGTHRDPAGYLKPIEAIWNNSPDGSFSFGGGWEWPVSDPAKINQGYGMTYYARVKRAYGGAPHTGIDLASKISGNYSVRAVKDGTLYRGSIKCGGGLLRYVRVKHQDDGIDTYYLHINY